MKPEDIITDAEIDRVHGYANFGSMGKREVVDEALAKAACGYHNGHTAQTIIAEHGLIVSSRRRGITSLTQRGRKYLYEVYCDLRKKTEEPERFFIGGDNSGHEYAVPVAKRDEWEAWVSLDEDDERSWDAPEFAIRIDGCFTFENPSS
ncbi:hypothetical protein [uncultured Roseibium sp.]|uniref:hypothetical protein n=1 Tax=uncultured Roseibium sp. TaxID=1936171 RepID=UPI0026182BE7|nr:hypothetical protein [uncultured Roseibium sp.]